MLTPKNNASFLRIEILQKVAKSFLDNRFAEADKIPEIIRPDGTQALRGSLNADRIYIKYAAMAAMGFCMNSLVESDQAKDEAAKLYLNAFRASFMKALPIGIYFLFFTLLFGAGFLVYSYLSPENAAYVSMSSISMVVLSFFWGFMMHMYPLMFDFDKTDWDNKNVFMRKVKLTELISETGRVAMYYWKQTALALVFVVLFFGSLLIFLPLTLPIIVLIGFSAIALAAAMAHTEMPY